MAKLQKQNVPFTQVANEMLNDKNLSFKAKGIFAYLFSKPDGWDFSGDRIKLDSKDGREAIFSGLKELEKAGLLTRIRLLNGRMDYHLKFSVDEPLAENPKEPKPQSAETRSISNKDILQTKNTAEQSSANVHIPEIIKNFETINKAAKRFYGNKTQRKACEDLIELYGIEKVQKVITQALPVTNQKSYFPTIVSPLQLLEKWSALEAGIKKHNDKKKTTTEKVGAQLW